MTDKDARADLADRMRTARVRAFLDPDEVAQPADEFEALLLRTAQIHVQAVTEKTRSAYARRWRKFEAWCGENGFTALPAPAETLMLYLAAAGNANGASLNTLRGWAAAIRRIHEEAGLASPTDDPAMRMFLRGLSRQIPPREKPMQISALRINGLREVIRTLDARSRDVREVRDRAVLGVIEAGAIVNRMRMLNWSEVQIDRNAVTVTLLPVERTSKSPVVVRAVARADDHAACPVVAMAAWRDLSATADDDGAVFTTVEGQQATQKRLGVREIGRIKRTRLDALAGEGKKASFADAMRLLAQGRTIDLRDKALLLVGWAGAHRRGEVVDLRWEDVVPRDGEGLVIHLRRTKTDQEGRHGAKVGIPYGRNPLTCPVTALAEWHGRVQQQLGDVDPKWPVFPGVTRAGRIGTQPLSPEALTKVVRRRAQDAGLQGHWGGRSLRAGFISTCADLEIPLEKIAAQSRHVTLESLSKYIRRADPFRGSAAGKVGL
ncbi:tyrosine-type recombinase/integrase [Nocardioides silvaticus]|nr:tyrosine-type recombinase/integrase [Nocardioides silvaticus]